MSSCNFRNFQNNFWIFCKFWILLNVDRTWHVSGCRITDFGLCFFVFSECDSHNYLPFNLNNLAAMHYVVPVSYVVALAGCHALGACWPDGRLTVSRLQSSSLLSSSVFASLALSISSCKASQRRFCAMLVNVLCFARSSFILLLYHIYRRCQVFSLIYFVFFADFHQFALPAWVR